jgi:hypothetical protein
MIDAKILFPLGMVSVAQLVRALDCGSRGWGFETPRSPFSSLSFSVGEAVNYLCHKIVELRGTL